MLKFAQAMYAASRDTVNLRGMTRFNRAIEAVNKMDNSHAESQQDSRKCYRCGGTSLLAKDCRFATEKCHNCGRWNTLRGPAK